MNSILNHFKNKNILITGHTGFKGAWLTFLLNQIGANITGISLSPITKPNLFECLKLDDVCNSIIGNINDVNLIEKIIIKNKPDIILHMAAQPLVRHSYKDPLETYTTNVIGTANVLNACRRLSKKIIVICVTTDKVYQNKEWEFPYRENDRLGGHDPYSASKAAAELVIDSFRNSFFNETKISVASVRAGNVIGGGDWSEGRLFPDIINSINSEKPIFLRNPSAVRPWQHVLDPIVGYLNLAKQMDLNPNKYNQGWNFGPHNHESKTVLEVCEQAISVFKKGEIKTVNNKNEPHEANLLKLDISKAMTHLDWKPKWNTEKAIEITSKWYKEFLEGGSATKLVKKDIDKFFNS